MILFMGTSTFMRVALRSK